MNARLADLTARYLPAGCPPFALAFSGGGDSLALLSHLCNHRSLAAVLHVDHGLRDSSSDDAAQAEGLATELGHALIVLRWDPKGSVTGLQEKARRARYGLMGETCRAAGIRTLVTAHHADDQAETVLMRLQRGSGWRGAAGMAPIAHAPIWPQLASLDLVRPALSLSRAALRAEMPALDPIEDPSNLDPSFTRIRMRRELAASPDLRRDMLELAADMRIGRDKEREHLARDLSDAHLTHEGRFTVPAMLSATALAMLAPIIGGSGGPLDRSRLVERRAALVMGKPVALGGGCLGLWDGETLTLSRDPVAMTGRSDGRLPASATRQTLTPEPAIWDGRFLINGAGGLIQPERRGHHVGYRILYGREVRVENLVAQRLQALLTGL